MLRHDIDDVIKWNHFPRYWPVVRRNPLTGGALMFFSSVPEQTVEQTVDTSVI